MNTSDIPDNPTVNNPMAKMPNITEITGGPLFGAAYYDEYMPKDLDRIDSDMTMMRAAGINVIRIAESTWSTCEPQPGIFDFFHVDRVLNAAEQHGIHIIIGTPTYAVPAWLVSMHPDVLAVTENGPGKYGARQIMDIVNPSYRFYAERVIRTLIDHVAQHPAVIGYQVDNETKYYGSVSPDMQRLFVKYLRSEFNNDFESLNGTFGLDYWSNRIDAWEDFPDLSGSINESLRAEFDRFRRAQVTEFLAWQADIVREYARDDQFVTQNFDYDWRGYSYGVQSQVDHFKAAVVVDIAGVDIYHPSEDDLTGKEIAFGGDVSRSLKSGENYLVLETEAQGQHGWLPYPGQLRLQAYSHLASGADGVMYWHWHSIHNSFETYWKGLLSHDLEPNPTYEEAGTFGCEIADPAVGRRVSHLQKHNQIAIMVSNESLSALEWFRIETGFPDGVGPNYNDIVRSIYDALFELNIECDFIPTDASFERLRQYAMVITPSMYCVSQTSVDMLKRYVRDGGHLVSTLRSFVSDEHVTVWHDRAPHDLDDVFGMSYNQFTRPKHVRLNFAKQEGTGAVDRAGVIATDRDESMAIDSAETAIDIPALRQSSLPQADAKPQANVLIELLKADDDTTVLASYDHYAWNTYAAITRHTFGQGSAEWIGTVLDAATLKSVMREAIESAEINSCGLTLSGMVTVRQGKNTQGEIVTYLLNYSQSQITFDAPVSGEVVVAPEEVGPDGRLRQAQYLSHGDSTLQVGETISSGERISIGPWNLAVIAG